MRALIVGAAGFVGGYLTGELMRNGYTVGVTKLPSESIAVQDAEVFDADVNDISAFRRAIETFSPDVIYHLAAQSSVKVSWSKPELTMRVNILGAVNLLEICRELYENGKKPKIILVGSSEEYGSVPPEACPIKEDAECCPGNVYALSKLTQNHLGRLYNRAYGMDIIMVRAFNHTGPGQSTAFVLADFCSQAAQIMRGEREPVMTVGNLEARRDFTDVRDIVRAYVMLAEKGRSGETYNVGSGRAVSIKELLDEVLRQAGTEIRVMTDPARMRPSDVPVHYADVTKLRTDTGWSPEIPLERMVRDTVEFFKNRK